MEDLLRGAGGVEDLQHVVSSIGHGNERADDFAERFTSIDRDNPPIVETKGDEDKREEINGRGSLYPSSDGFTTEE